jgi:hypothetical protein
MQSFSVLWTATQGTGRFQLNRQIELKQLSRRIRTVMVYENTVWVTGRTDNIPKIRGYHTGRIDLEKLPRLFGRHYCLLQEKRRSTSNISTLFSIAFTVQVCP